MPNYKQTFKTLSYPHTTVGDGLYAEDLGFFAFGLGVHNRTSGAVQLFPSKYSDDYLTIPANSYKEVAVTTNYFRVEYSGTGEEISISVVTSPALAGLLAPLFPNLYAPEATHGGSENFKLNPINAYGYTFTPWVTGDLSQEVGVNSTLIDLEYYVNGSVKSFASSTNFYEELFSEILTQVKSFQPPGYVPPYNPEYSPTTAVEIVEKVRGMYETINNTYYEEEFLFGYLALETYDDDLRRATFILDESTDADRIVLPTVLAFTVEALDGGAVLQYYTKGNEDTPTEVVLEESEEEETENPSQFIVDEAEYFVVTSGRVKLSFTGQMVKMIEFAPIINIVYPLGFTETEGLPSEDFATFAQALAAFKQHLEDNRFTGRVIYFRAQPFEAQDSPVWNAGKWVLEQGIKPIPYVWDEIRQYAHNYHAYSRLEKDLLVPIVHENMSYYYDGGGELQNPLPTMLEEVIENENVTIRGLATDSEKKEFLKTILIAEYVGQYSLGGAWFNTPGVSYNKKN